MERFGDKVICNPSVKLEKGNTYPHISIDKITPGLRTVETNELVEYTGQGGSKFEDGDVLMARITHCLENGKTAIAKTNGKKGMGSTEFFVFRGIDGVTDSKYIYYLLRLPYMRNLAANSMTGASGRQRADLGFIKKIPWSYPDIQIQREIVKYLSTYDELIETNKKKIQTLEEIVTSTYKEWFVRFRFPGYKDCVFEKGIPQGWEVRKVKSLVKRLPFGKLYKADDLQPEGNVIVIDQSTDEYVGFHSDEPSHVASLDDPIALFGDHSCKYKLMITPFSLSENVIPYKAETGIELIYLYYALRGLVETTEYKRHWSELMAKKVLLAPEALQEDFVEMVKPMIDAIQTLNSENRIIERQRDLLLPRLMGGSLGIKL